MDGSLRDLSWIKAANVVTAWACQTDQISEARLKWKALEVKQNQKSFESLFIKVDLCLIRHGWDDWAKKNVEDVSICCAQDSLAQVVSAFWWKALWSLALHCWGEVGGVTSSSQARPTDPSVSQIQLVLFFFFLRGEEEEISVPSRWADFISSHCPLNYFRLFPSNTYTSHQWLCAQQSTSEVVPSSSWVHHESGLSFCDSALTLQSVLALAWFNSGLSEAHATWRLEIRHFFSLFLLRPNIKESLNLLIVHFMNASHD